MTTGRRYTAEEALSAGIVQHIAAEAEVLPTAVGIAAALAPKNGLTVGKIRTDLYRPVIETLGGPAF
jgi:enoyl-CoA hydratase/carnithine racemase